VLTANKAVVFRMACGIGIGMDFLVDPFGSGVSAPMKWRACIAAFALGLCTSSSQAQEMQINEAPYDEIAALEPTTQSFDDLGGLQIGTAFEIEGAMIGQILEGQSLDRRAGRGLDDHWVLAKRDASLPLGLAADSEPPVAVVVWDGAFDSYALAGFGPQQYGPGRMRSGTGIVTILFDEVQCLFGFRTWLDGNQDNIVMRRYPEGNLNVIFWNEAGQQLADFRRYIDQGQVEVAYIQSSGSYPEIRAVTIQNLDPEGIGIDEIVYAPMCPMIVSGREADTRNG